MKSQPRYYTTQQVANKIGVHKSSLLEWIEKGYLPDPQRDLRGWRAWTEEDLKRALAWKKNPWPLGRLAGTPKRRQRVREPAPA
jgi:hypothetical protein